MEKDLEKLIKIKEKFLIEECPKLKEKENTKNTSQ
jgi:hypothetical protein